MLFSFNLERRNKRYRTLDRYFKDNVLNDSGFICPYSQECKSSFSGDFYEGQLHYIGKYYDLRLNNKPFRIVVVGKEYGYNFTNYSLDERYGNPEEDVRGPLDVNAVVPVRDRLGEVELQSSRAVEKPDAVVPVAPEVRVREGEVGDRVALQARARVVPDPGIVDVDIDATAPDVDALEGRFGDRGVVEDEPGRGPDDHAPQAPGDRRIVEAVASTSADPDAVLTVADDVGPVEPCPVRILQSDARPVVVGGVGIGDRDVLASTDHQAVPALEETAALHRSTNGRFRTRSRRIRRSGSPRPRTPCRLSTYRWETGSPRSR